MRWGQPISITMNASIPTTNALATPQLRSQPAWRASLSVSTSTRAVLPTTHTTGNHALTPTTTALTLPLAGPPLTRSPSLLSTLKNALPAQSITAAVSLTTHTTGNHASTPSTIAPLLTADSLPSTRSNHSLALSSEMKIKWETDELKASLFK